LGSDSRDETTIAATGIKGKNFEASTSNSAQSAIDEENEKKRRAFPYSSCFQKSKD